MNKTECEIICGNHDNTETKKNEEGRRGGVRERMRKRLLPHIMLPSIILANARSLRNKIEELHTHVCFKCEFRDSCLLAISETWFEIGL